MEKQPCKECGALIQPATYEKNNGLCAFCAQGIKKTTCDICGNEVLIPVKSNGKSVCLKCTMKASQETGEHWKTLCNPDNYPYDPDSLKIKPYPNYYDVFTDDSLKGFYYPLCTLTFNEKATGNGHVLHFVSHNGLWIDGENDSGEVNDKFSKFTVKSGKYAFSGKLSAFTGAEYVAGLFDFLSEDFEQNKNAYLTPKASANNLIEKAKRNYKQGLANFDSDYYIETFFSYFLRKTKFETIDKSLSFVPVNKLSENDLFLPYNSADFLGIGEELIVNENHFKYPANLIGLLPVGACWGDRYFHDGNNCFLFYDERRAEAFCVNQYS